MSKKTKALVAITLILAFILGVLVGGLIIYEYMYPKNMKLIEDIDVLTNELEFKNASLNDLQLQLSNVQDKLCDEVKKTNELNNTLNEINTELHSTSQKLEDANTIVADLKSSGYELLYLGDFQLTHYCNERREHICGYGKGITATGTTATVGRTIAVDPRVIPYGSQVYIEGYGLRYAEDCGGGVKGNQIDILVDTHSEALGLGVQYGGVWIVVEQTS